MTMTLIIYSVVNFKQQNGEEQGEHTSLITHAETCNRSIWLFVFGVGSLLFGAFLYSQAMQSSFGTKYWICDML